MTSEMKNLETKVCACGAIAKQVIHAASNTRKGWYCPKCAGFVKTIGRERVMSNEG